MSCCSFAFMSISPPVCVLHDAFHFIAYHGYCICIPCAVDIEYMYHTLLQSLEGILSSISGLHVFVLNVDGKATQMPSPSICHSDVAYLFVTV